MNTLPAALLLALFVAGVFSGPALASNDPFFDEQWYLANDGRSMRVDITDSKSKFRAGVVGADIGFQRAHEILKGKPLAEVVVAVFDTGVDYDHEELRDRIHKNDVECENGRLPLGRAKEDKDGNGYPGDCLGIDVTARDKRDANRPDDKNGHGTHVASLIAASSDNGVGIKGIGNSIKILPVKVTTGKDAPGAVSYSDRVAEGIRYAIGRGAQVINMSWGWPISHNTQAAIQAFREAREKGVLIVAAAGNNGHSMPVFPCAYEGVLCVGSTRNDDKTSAFSNYGSHVDILAPGEKILGAIPSDITPLYFSVNGYEIKSGTSQAAPLVAGAAALMKSALPDASWDEIVGRLLESAKPVENSEFSYFNRGRIDLARALSAPSTRLVKWEYKETAIAEVAQDLTFEIKLKFKNYSSRPQHRRIEVSSLTEGVELSSSRVLSFSANELKLFPVAGKVSALAADSQFQFEVRMIDNDSETPSARQVLKGEIILARSLKDISGAKILPVENSEGVPRFLAMPEIDNEVSGSIYYSFETDEKDREKPPVMRTWGREASRVAYLGQRNLEQIRAPVLVLAGDYDLDSTLDILVIGLGGTSEDPVYSLCYLKSNLEPLLQQACYPILGPIIFDYRMFSNHRQLRWQKKTMEGRTVLVPSLIANGKIPAQDLDAADRRGANPVTRHIYGLEFTATNDQRGFLPRALDGSKWRKRIHREFDLAFYESIQPVAALESQDPRQGEFLVNIGQLERSKMLRVRFDDETGDSKVEVLKWQTPLNGYKPGLGWSDADMTRPMNLLFGIVNQSRGHIVTLDLNDPSRWVSSLVLDLLDETEHLQYLLMASVQNGQTKAIVESSQRLYGFIGTGDTIKQVHERRLARTTFFNRDFSQITLPVIARNKEAVLYVDNVRVNARNAFVWRLDESRGFVAPLLNNVSVPEDCTPMNPTRWTLEGGSQMSFLCSTAAGYELRFVAIE